eukprot:CAMPEP_0197468076 /NCGR_PEP_ID=MMETSP1175-20131217/65899_1 /TAXON_ID=1003142 /ORGANISM="Triceratium dubium, Strain CCMP147" /LENGTH=61 /DNA_ID=CAMNT_0043004171 /DNA_START=23 /DNA_END=208 /DNA_ORIENTATION=+
MTSWRGTKRINLLLAQHEGIGQEKTDEEPSSEGTVKTESGGWVDITQGTARLPLKALEGTT